MGIIQNQSLFPEKPVGKGALKPALHTPTTLYPASLALSDLLDLTCTQILYNYAE